MRAQDDAPPQECDFLVVGAGIVGLAAARELAHRHDGARVAVLEREPGIARQQTGHSSGVIHAGIYYEPGSLKARLCVAGARELYDYCAEREIPTWRGGKLIVATAAEELGRLDELERRGSANGVDGLRRLQADQISDVEPHAAGIAALHSPATGTVDFGRVAAALAEDLAALGGSVATGCEVAAIRDTPAGVAVTHSLGRATAPAVVTCAGAWSDCLAVAAGASADPRIVPFRGAYLRLRDERAHLVRSNVYPVPDPALPFLGAHLTRAHTGEVLLGPTALIAPGRGAHRVREASARELADTLAWPGTWRLARRHWRAALAEVRHAMRPAALVERARRLVPELRRADFVPGPAGIRGQALGRDGSLVDDFVVSRTGAAIHVRNAPSPAATAALALAREIADQVDAVL